MNFSLKTRRSGSTTYTTYTSQVASIVDMDLFHTVYTFSISLVNDAWSLKTCKTCIRAESPDTPYAVSDVMSEDVKLVKSWHVMT